MSAVVITIIIPPSSFFSFSHTPHTHPPNKEWQNLNLVLFVCLFIYLFLVSVCLSLFFLFFFFHSRPHFLGFSQYQQRLFYSASAVAAAVKIRNVKFLTRWNSPATRRRCRKGTRRGMAKVKREDEDEGEDEEPGRRKGQGTRT